MMKARRYFAASSCCLLISTALFIGRRLLLPTKNQCMVHMWPYSPAFQAVEYSWFNFADYFYPSSPLRGDPNQDPELEERWNNYTYQGIISVPLEKLSDLQADPKTNWWPVSPEDGGGIAAVLSIHYQTNCLNMIRKYIHRDTYDYSSEDLFNPAKTTSGQLQAQVEQCIEALRQELVCHVDQSLYLVWKDPAAWGGNNEDNGVRHMCRSYDKIKDWAEQNTLQKLYNPGVYFPLVN